MFKSFRGCNCKREVGYYHHASSTNFSNISTNMQLSHLIKNKRKGKLQYSNYYRTTSSINSLGYFEGQLGGSGVPLRNSF